MFATIGIRVYEGTPLAGTAVQEGQVKPDQDLFEPAYYLSPGLAEDTEIKLDRIARRRAEWTSPVDWRKAVIALGTKSNRAAERAAAVEIHPQLRRAHETGNTVSNALSHRCHDHFLRRAGHRRRRGGRGGGHGRRARRRASGVAGTIRFSGRTGHHRAGRHHLRIVSAGHDRRGSHAGRRRICAGICLALATRRRHKTPPRVDTGLWVLPYSPPAFARVADAMVGESKNVTVILHATVAEAQAEGSRLNQVRALAWNEPLLFRPNTVVDCTGEATAAALAGANAENGGADQAPALVFVLENVDPGLAERGLLEVRRELRRAVESGTLPALCERLSLVPGTGANGRLAFKFSLLPANPDRALWQQVTDWEREARALLEPLRRFLVENIAACRNARLDSVAPQLGVRSGRRILGRARLTDEDVLGARKSPSGIARGCWPMERWTNSPRPEMTYFAERDYYDIPLDCLRPVELDNVFVAGRCLSATTGAMTSARVIGTALATGWAAGTAAAFQASGRPLDDAVAQIREHDRSGRHNAINEGWQYWTWIDQTENQKLNFQPHECF